MKFEVMSRQNAKRYSFKKHDEKSIIISITNVDLEDVIFNRNINNGIIDILRLKFDDVEKGEINCIIESDVKQIVKFINKYKNIVDKIIVHCEAGVSRSSGVCGAIMKAIQGDDWDIFNNPKFCPNMTCYRIVLNGFMELNERELIELDKFSFLELVEKVKCYNKVSTVTILGTDWRIDNMKNKFTEEEIELFSIEFKKDGLEE